MITTRRVKIGGNEAEIIDSLTEAGEKTLTEMLQALEVVGTINVDTNTFTPAIEEQSETTKLGPELLDLAAAEPTLDRYLDRSYKLNTAEDRLELVKILQRKRQLFITAEGKKKSGDKTEGKTDDETVV